MTAAPQQSDEPGQTGTTGWAGRSGLTLSRLKAWLVSSDPGLLRLTRAARISLAIVLAGAGSVAIAWASGIGFAQLILGVAVGGMAPLMITDTAPRSKLITTLLFPIPAALAFALSALLAPVPFADQALFLLVIFVTMLVQPLDPRAKGLAMSAFLGTMMGGFLAPAPPTILPQLASLVPDVAMAGLVMLVLLPDRPAATLQRIIKSVEGRAAAVVELLHTELRRGSPDKARLDAAMAAVIDAALNAEDQAVAVAGKEWIALRQRLVNLEVALGRLVSSVLDASPLPAREQARLRLLARRIRTGSFPVGEPGKEQELPPVGIAIQAVDRAASSLARVTPPRAETPIAAATPNNAGAASPLAWQMASQVLLASALGIGGGMLLSPNRWFWAALTTFTVFVGTRSRGDTLLKIGTRTLATLAGVGVGIVIAALVGGHAVVGGITTFACVFIGFYAMGALDILFIGAMTVMLGVLYGLVGISAEKLLILRLEETLVGGLAAIAVVLLLAPISTRDNAQRSAKEMFLALADCLKVIGDRLAGNPSGSPLESTRLVDRKLKDLRVALLPVARQPFFMKKSAVAQAFPALFASARAAKSLAIIADETASPATPRQVARLQEIASSVRAMADTPPGGQPRMLETSAAGPGSVDRNSVDAALDQLTRTVSLASVRLSERAFAS